jgi:hypothetical protein
MIGGEVDLNRPLPLAGEGGGPARSAGEGEGIWGVLWRWPAALTPALSRKRERE